VTRSRAVLVGLVTTIGVLVIGTVVGGVALLQTTYKVYSMPSTSMQPALPLGSFMVVHRDVPPRDGDVVVFSPSDWRTGRQSEGAYVKRVIASGGETVQAGVDGVVVRDGKRLDEPYADISSDLDISARFGPVTVPAGRLWLLGDNRPNSADSRFHVHDPNHGTVARDDVVGVVVAHGGRADTYGYVALRAMGLSAVGALVAGLVVAMLLWRRRGDPAVGGPSWGSEGTMEGP
jgi:signal peptidase I